METLNKFAKAKVIREFLNEMKLNVEDYPFLNETAQKKYINYALKEDDWMRLEERFYDDKKALEFLVEFLFKRKRNEAFSIVMRHDLLSKLQRDDMKEEFETMKSFKSRTIPNQIFKYDDFWPIEELLLYEKEYTYINLEGFGIQRKHVIFVDSVKSQDFAFSENELLNSKMVNSGFFFYLC